MIGTRKTRKIVTIDETKCDGCGLCVPNCAEGAIRIINGKARLVAENLCDGLGACLGKCPCDAITVEERAAEEFDEQAVTKHLAVEGEPAVKATAPQAQVAHGHGGGCPDTMLRQLKQRGQDALVTRVRTDTVTGEARPSRLAQWPVQLALVPTAGPIWQGADVLIAADCVAYALADAHERLMAGRTVAIACPKLDDVQPYVQKLAEIFGNNDVRSITVARMEVPCCGGLDRVVKMAMAIAGKDIPVSSVIVGIDGRIVEG